MECAYCHQPIRRSRREDGIDPEDYPWTHYFVRQDGSQIANPKCDNGGLDERTGAWDDGTWAEPAAGSS